MDLQNGDDTAPLREQIGEVLRQHILQGKFGASGRLPSVRKLAEEYRLSKSTVANAIAGLKKQGLLRSTLKQGVYICSGAAPDTSGRKRTGRIGLFAHGTDDILRERIYFEGFNGVRRAAVERGYNVVYMGSEVAADSAAAVPRGVRDVDGLVYMISREPSREFLREMLRRKIPTVMFDSRDEQQRFDSVLVDNIGGARSAVRHLIKLGHRRIGFLNSSSGQSAPERLLGYREALDEAGIGFDPKWVSNVEPTVAGGRGAMRELLKLKPSALFAFSDYLAMGAILAAEDAGLNVPKDLSVAGFGNEGQTTFQDYTGRALTTVDVKMADMGAECVRLLLKSIKTPGEPAQTIRIPSELILGNTTAKKSARG